MNDEIQYPIISFYFKYLTLYIKKGIQHKVATKYRTSAVPSSQGLHVIYRIRYSTLSISICYIPY